MRFPKLAVGVTCLLLVGSALAAWIDDPIDPVPAPQVVFRSNLKQFTSDHDPSFDELGAVSDAMVLGTPLPSGMTATTHDGKIVAAITDSLEGPPAEYAISVTLKADSTLLDTAQLLLNDVVIFRASRVGGSIVDRNGMALATLTGLVPQIGPFQLKLTWTAADGRVREASIHF